MTRRSGRAAVMNDYLERLEIQEFPVPAAEPGGLLVRMEVSTVCGSDLHVWRGHLADVMPISPPLILGHEMVGLIEELPVGSGVDSTGTALSIGDRVVWEHASCGRCRECTRERAPQLCTDRYIAYLRDCSRPPHFTGTFAEYGLVVPQAGRVRVPDGVKSTWASAGSCALRTVVKAAATMGRIATSDTVLVQGAGPLGLFATAVASLSNPRRIIVVGGPTDRLEVARAWGATHTVDVTEYTTPEARLERVLELSDGVGVERAFELAGAPGAVAEGVRMLRRNGRYVVMGTLGGGPQPIDAALITTRGLTVIGSMSGEIGDYAEALEILDRFQGRFDWDLLFGNTYSLDNVSTALESMASQREIKPVIALV